MKSKPIVVVGSLNLDLVVHAERIPLSGETVAGHGYDESLGGKGANQAVAAARLGNEVCMIGCVGCDAYGKRLRDGMQSHGVDLSATAIVDGPSGLAVITHARNGANSIVVIPGANGALDTIVIERHTEMIQGAAVLLLQLETPMEAVVLAAGIASRAGVLVVLDPAPARDLPNELIATATWITPNETEAAQLLHTAEPMNTESVADRLLALGARNVALKLGDRGVLIKGRDCPAATMVPAFTVKAVDSTAAGDCFNAAFASRLVYGSAPAEAARYANAAAAISVTRLGAQASMPKADEVEVFLKSKEAASDAI
jgi:ribokinase